MFRSRYFTLYAIQQIDFAFQAVIYSLTVIPTCEGVVFYQCVDFLVVLNQRSRAIYYLYTMMMSFILPFIVAIISYSLLVYEISNMKRKEKGIVGEFL